MIELRGVVKTFKTKAGPIEALKDVNLKIEDGEIFGIIGLSGAGKSTLVRCVNLLERPDAGEILIDGEDLTGFGNKKLREIRRNIGMIFQSFNLLEQRNVFDNVKFPLEISGVKKAEAEKKVNDLIELVGLKGRERSYPSQLSGGQKQRVAIARALATDPKYLLCDEATSALDPTTTGSILELLKDINRKFGVTIVVITHEMRVVESICSRVAVLSDGKIAECGSVGEVFYDPESAIARELILPNLVKAINENPYEYKLRVTFNGAALKESIISLIAVRLGISVKVLYSDEKTVNGRTFGQILLAVPDGAAAEKIKALCEGENLTVKEV